MARRKEEISCLGCGTSFKPARESTKYCSLPCATKSDFTARAGMKTCRGCNLLLEVAEFSLNYRAGDGRTSKCKKCRNAEAVEYRQRTKPWRKRTYDESFSQQLKKRYGIDLAEYDSMFATQGGLCAVCQKPERSWNPKTGTLRRLAVHHNHRTGKVIALCCSECNLGMGKLMDDPVLLRRAAELNEV